MRLTERSKNKNSDMVWFKDTENEGMRLEPCEMSAHHSRIALEKLAAYEDAEEQGLLLRLPCKVGDNIYIIKTYGIEEASIIGISEADDIDCFCFEVYIDPDCHEIIALKEFNDTWFLTREEAEAKLKEMEGEHGE